MSALLPRDTKAHDQFVVSHGKSGALGVFTAPLPLPLRRGCQVLVQTQRGVEVGSVLCSASLLQARLLGATSSGALVRAVTAEDASLREERAALEQTIFDAGRDWVAHAHAVLEILDVDLLFDGKTAILQYVEGAAAQPPTSQVGSEALAESLEQQFHLSIRLENLATPHHEGESESEHKHGCDKPDCGKASGGGGCTSCGSGGCSSCGTGKVDMRPYFSHLRDKMDTQRRIPLA